MVIEFGGYQFDDEPTRVDRDAVWLFLSSQAYWARWRTRQDVERQLDSAWRMVGAYEAAGDGRMVGFSRAISNGVAFANLADVYVVDTARGQGLGKGLTRVMIDCGPGVGFRWTSHTALMATASIKRAPGPRSVQLTQCEGGWFLEDEVVAMVLIGVGAVQEAPSEGFNHGLHQRRRQQWVDCGPGVRQQRVGFVETRVERPAGFDGVDTCGDVLR